MGLKVKLDTNGSFPDRLEELLSKGLLDYVAMDIKSSPSQDKYDKASGIRADLSAIKRSAELLLASRIDYEFRTTVVPGLVENEDIEAIGRWLKGAKSYHIQQFIPESPLSPEFKSMRPYAQEKLAEFKKTAERYFLNVGVRGI